MRTPISELAGTAVCVWLGVVTSVLGCLPSLTGLPYGWFLAATGSGGGGLLLVRSASK